MAASDLKFGTSGLRGLVVDLQGAAARQWTSAFLGIIDTRSVSYTHLTLPTILLV